MHQEGNHGFWIPKAISDKMNEMEAQLAAQAALLREAAEVVRWVENTFAYTHTGMHTKAAALLPRLEAAWKERP